MQTDLKREIYKAFVGGDLKVKSVSRDKKVEWKRVVDVLQHDVSNKDQYRVCAEGEWCTITGDHSLYTFNRNDIEECFVRKINVGTKLVTVKDDVVIEKVVTAHLSVPPQKYMYDLSVEDNHNYVLISGILAHNTFRPPMSEKFIQGQTQVFGFIWEDEELVEYILMAVDDFNSRPPVTGLQVQDLWGTSRRWRTGVLLRAGAFACFAATATWIANEFSYSISGVSLDIEKSSKYQSLKDEFINEADKIFEASKRSLKHIVGLRQQRFGIGLQSALGPLSRSGVQSRRNFIESSRPMYA